MSDTTHADDGSLEGPDVEKSTGADEVDATGGHEGIGDNDGEGTAKPGGLGADGTIPSDPDGVVAGHTGEPSTFEPEEDEQA
ncbi:hypothetical protein [uncultured Microbacterium sp.]|uniref:hypothetical protein n=1 Tax=uncultured Microbacterium sp. TaxID=191216 RepID=UPI0035CB01D4